MILQSPSLMDILLKYDCQPGYMASPISGLAFNTDPDGDLNFPLLASMADPSCSESIINWNTACSPLPTQTVSDD